MLKMVTTIIEYPEYIPTLFNKFLNDTMYLSSKLHAFHLNEIYTVFTIEFNLQ